MQSWACRANLTPCSDHCMRVVKPKISSRPVVCRIYQLKSLEVASAQLRVLFASILIPGTMVASSNVSTALFPGASISSVCRPAGPSLQDHLGTAAPVLQAAGMAGEGLVHVGSRSYHLNCNWKVFCDNYLVSWWMSMPSRRLIVGVCTCFSCKDGTPALSPCSDACAPAWPAASSPLRIQTGRHQAAPHACMQISHALSLNQSSHAGWRLSCISGSP